MGVFDNDKLVIDMVHHNPAEEKFKTEFLNPRKCFEYGYNGQVFKHLTCAATYEKFDKDLCRTGSAARIWIDNLAHEIEQQITNAKKSGLKIYYHIDLFLVPTQLYEKYKNELCDENGRISIYRPQTLIVHRALFDELFDRFQVDGLIVRMGETYTWESPYHTGNSPVDFNNAKLGKTNEKKTFTDTITFLREEICCKYNKKLIIRTWDTKIDRFHADETYYLDVTDGLVPHRNLFFSIKHTKLDFYKAVDANPCLTKGKHQQIIEIQCQREYEGKGAFPNYVMREVIEGYYCNEKRQCIRDIVKHPNIKGLYTWSRGGGFFGPYIKNEFWCDLHAYVISRWFRNPELGEDQIFYEYAQKQGFGAGDCAILRKICLLSSEAVLKGHYCSFGGSNLDLRYLLWTRDDRIGGLDHLSQVFDEIINSNKIQQALDEKLEAVQLFETIVSLSKNLKNSNPELIEFIKISSEYGMIYFSIIYYGWVVMLLGYHGDKLANYDLTKIQDAIAQYDKSWAKFRLLASSSKLCPTLFIDKHWGWPGENSLGANHNLINPAMPGIGDSVDRYRKLMFPNQCQMTLTGGLPV